MDLAEIIKGYTEKALLHYGDSATKRFYEFLSKKEFKTTSCKKCGIPFFPPKPFCPHCFGDEVEWVDMPKKGKLYAFTQQERSLRFGKPDVIGIVELDGIGRILTRINAPFGSLKIGMDVHLDFIDVGGLILHQFVPD